MQMSQLAEQPNLSSRTDRDVILCAQAIAKGFVSGESEVRILKGTDFTLRQGEFVAIEGRSGSGKSTLLHILGALESLDSGSTQFDGVEYAMLSRSDQQVWKPYGQRLGYWMKIELGCGFLLIGAALTGWLLREMYHWATGLFFVSLAGVLLAMISLSITAIIYEQRERPRARIRNTQFGFVFQFYHLLPELNALQNAMLASAIKFSFMNYLGHRAALKQRATDLLTQLGLAHRLYHKPSQLSGGERQRVAIARALMNCPKVLFADEPTGNLDAETGRQIMDVLEKLHRDHGQTIVMVTHDRTLAREADRVLVLKDGKLQPAV
jgi:ABC-type lipoprotein export system ATPase subunit